MEGISQALVAHTCNPSHSGGRDQEDYGLKLAQANGSRDPILKNPITKNWAGGVVQGVSPEFKNQYCKKKKEKFRAGDMVQAAESLPSKCTRSWVQTPVLQK
jgi:hypothetical protein